MKKIVYPSVNYIFLDYTSEYLKINRRARPQSEYLHTARNLPPDRKSNICGPNLLARKLGAYYPHARHEKAE